MDYGQQPYDDTPELQIPPAGKQMDLVIASYEEGMSKENPEEGKVSRPMITITIEANDGSGKEYEGIRHWMTFNTEEEFVEAKAGDKEMKNKVDMMTRGIKRFCAVFEIEPSGLPTNLPGATGRTSCTHAPNPQNPMEPFVRLVLPRMR